MSTEVREALLRRWLRLMVERSTLDELSTRPLAERIKEFELLLEAAGESGLGIPASGPVATPEAPQHGLEAELERQCAAGAAFSLALLAGGDDWRAALQQAGAGEPVLEGPGGTTAILLPGLVGADARAAVDRLRVAAWRELGSHGRLAEVALASCPGDAAAPAELLQAAQFGLSRLTAGERREERLERAVAEHHERVHAASPAAADTAVVTPLPLPSSRLEPEWGPWAPRT